MARKKPGKNPFKPGTATKPGYLAGRDAEKTVLKQALEAISEPQNETTGRMADSPRSPVKIIGPRGVGKTTLVKEARLMAEAQKIHVVLTGRLDKLDSNSKLYVDLLAGLQAKSAQRKVKSLLADVSTVKIGPVGMSWNNKQHALLTQVFTSFLMKQPLALLVDEAMTCEPRLLGDLLFMCQEMIAYQYPLMLLLAGTPRLDQMLGGTNASFIVRTKNLYINALEPVATREALHKPFEKGGAKVKPKALDLMAGMTDDYPFFIQIVGYWAWEEMVAAQSDEVDEKMVARAKAKIQRERDEFYQLIYGEMKKNVGLLGHARFVMQLLKLNRGRVTDDMITDTLAERFAEDAEERALDVFHKLVDFGFIWSRGGEIEAGIPSFFNYCDAKARKTAKLRRPGAKK